MQLRYTNVKKSLIAWTSTGDGRQLLLKQFN